MKNKKTTRPDVPSGSTITKNGKQYFVYGDLLIEISEHFADNGKSLDHLIENVIIHAAKKVS